MTKSFQAAAAAALTGLVGGCFFSQSGSTGSASTSTSWNIDGPDAVPGIASGALTQVTLTKNSHEASFAVWSDLTNGIASDGGDKTAHFSGRHSDRDGVVLDFEATLNERGMATVTIAGRRYDLAKGGLFLASMQGGQPRVAQLNFDVLGMAWLDGKQLKELGESTEEIRRFFEEHQMVESTEAE